MKPIRVFVTGVSGFIGRALMQRLAGDPGFTVVASSRSIRNLNNACIETFVSGPIDGATRWIGALSKIDVVVHLAARAHVLRERSGDPLGEFRRTNVEGTLHLAEQAAQSGVKRFVFISTIGVNGARTSRQPFTAEDRAEPHSPYAQSKYEAELGLHALADKTGMELVIIRPPLVYGPNAPGNFGSLVRWIRRGVPLPLGALRDNRRSFVAIDNLVDLMVTCIRHPAAANQTLMVSDGDDLSTTELLLILANAVGKSAHLIGVPAPLLRFAALLANRPDVAERLCGSLQVDISRTCNLLGWTPPISVEEGLRRAASC